MGKSIRPTPTHSTQPTLANHFAPLASNAEHAATATPHSPLAPPRHSSSPDATVVDACLDQPPTPPSASTASSTLIPSQEVIAFHSASADSLTSAPQSTLSSSPSPGSPSLSSTADNSTVTDGVVGGQPDNGNADNAAAMDDDGYTLQTRRTKKGKRKDPPPQPKPNSKPTISISRNTDKEDKRDSDGSPTCRRIRRRTSTPPATPTATTTHRSAASTARLSSSSPASSSSASVAATRPSTPVASPNAGASSTATVVGTAVAAAVARALQPHPDRVADIQQPIPARAFSATVVQPVAHQSLASNSPATRQRPTGNSAVQSSLQQQQQPPQPRPRAAAAPPKLIARCGATELSDTSFVLTLSANTAQPGYIASKWSRLPRPSPKNSRSRVAIARLLDNLSIPLPPLPRAYIECNTVEELTHKLQQRTDTSQPVTDWAERVSRLPANDNSALASFLIDSADSVRANTRDADGLTRWLDLLTPRTACLSRRSAPQQAAAPARQADNSRCVLRLDIASPLVRLCVAHHLGTISTQLAASPDAQLRQPVSWTVQPYRRRLIAAQVSGLDIGPTSVDLTGRFTSMSEPFGSWQTVRQWLLSVAPHCSPSREWTTLNNGTAAVEFVLEPTYLHELDALKGQTAPTYGITRPLRLHVSTLLQSTTVACSTCGTAGHKARDCPQRPPNGVSTCKNCFTPDHRTADCTVARTEQVCKLCSERGHTTLGCRQYRPRWTDVAKQGDAQRRAAQPAQPSPPRNTFNDELTAQLQGRTFTRAAPHTAPQQRSTQPAHNLPSPADFPPLPAGSTTAARRPTADTHRWTTQQDQTLGPARSSTEQDVQQLVGRIEALEQSFAKALRAQQEWMEAMLSRLIKPHESPPPKQQPEGFDGQHYNLSPHGCSHLTSPTAAPAQHYPHPHTWQDTTAATSKAPATADGVPPHPTFTCASCHFHAHNVVVGAHTAHLTAGGALDSRPGASADPLEEKTAAAQQRSPHTASQHHAGQHSPPAYGAQPAPTTVHPNEQ